MDSFFGIGMMELFFIALIALIVLGPERMPGDPRGDENDPLCAQSVERTDFSV